MRSCTSSNSRVFSIAITAWSAKVSTSAICFCVKGSQVAYACQARGRPRPAVAHHQHGEDRAEAGTFCA